MESTKAPEKFVLEQLEKFNGLAPGTLPQLVLQLPDGAFQLSMTQFFLHALGQDIVANRRVLDFGTGTGIVACLAALLGAKSVVATDNNPQVLRCAENNLRLNGFFPEKVELQLAHGFALPQRYRGGFDVVISNPAQIPLPYTIESLGDYFVGVYGRLMIDMVVENCCRFLSDSGVVLLTHSSLSNPWQTVNNMVSKGFSCEVLGCRSFPLYGGLEDPEVLDHLLRVGREIWQEDDGGYWFKTYFLKFVRGHKNCTK